MYTKPLSPLFRSPTYNNPDQALHTHLLINSNSISNPNIQGAKSRTMVPTGRNTMPPSQQPKHYPYTVFLSGPLKSPTLLQSLLVHPRLPKLRPAKLLSYEVAGPGVVRYDGSSIDFGPEMFVKGVAYDVMNGDEEVQLRLWAQAAVEEEVRLQTVVMRVKTGWSKKDVHGWCWGVRSVWEKEVGDEAVAEAKNSAGPWTTQDWEDWGGAAIRSDIVNGQVVIIQDPVIAGVNTVCSARLETVDRTDAVQTTRAQKPATEHQVGQEVYSRDKHGQPSDAPTSENQEMYIRDKQDQPSGEPELDKDTGTDPVYKVPTHASQLSEVCSSTKSLLPTTMAGTIHTLFHKSGHRIRDFISKSEDQKKEQK